MQIHIFQIKVNPGRRETDPETVHKLADSISKVGLINPITVDQEYINSASDRLRWTHHFKAFSTMTTLDRRAVIAMVHSIKVMGKNDLKITFRYQMEFRQSLERLEQHGQLTPPLLVLLTTLREQEKEAA